ncbi:MAG: hypothetical protein QXE66_03320 [Desulfurococcaceae archaeon]
MRLADGRVVEEGWASRLKSTAHIHPLVFGSEGTYLLSSATKS